MTKTKKATVISKDGYETVDMYAHGNRYKRRVHRLVAIAYIKNDRNPAIYGIVHHIDKDRSNNSIGNLMWVSAKENNNHY